MIYPVDETSETLRFAYDAGITDRRARRLIRDLTLPIGVGMFGTTVSRRELTVTDDYPVDKRFEHSHVADEIVGAAGMRSMAVTPLVAGERVIGAMGAYANRPAAFSEAQIRLLRALGDHAATAIANRQQAAAGPASRDAAHAAEAGRPDHRHTRSGRAAAAGRGRGAAPDWIGRRPPDPA